MADFQIAIFWLEAGNEHCFVSVRDAGLSSNFA